jgi:hypothetical protein
MTDTLLTIGLGHCTLAIAATAIRLAWPLVHRATGNGPY